MVVVKDGEGNGSGTCLRRFSLEIFINNGRVLFAFVESLHFQIDTKNYSYFLHGTRGQRDPRLPVLRVS
jgi:hypothetical protein